MSFSCDDNELEMALIDAFGSPPNVDFDAWRRQHSEAIACLNSERTRAFARRRQIMNRVWILTAAAAVLLCVWLGTSDIANRRPNGAAFAQAVAQAKNAKSVTWKTTFYTAVLDQKGGKPLWVETETRENSYRSPGVLREVRLDENMQPVEVSLEDNVRLKHLSVYHRTKQATVREMVFPESGVQGPFEPLTNGKDDSYAWVGKQEVAGRDINIFRETWKGMTKSWIGGARKMDWSQDIWVDAKTKRIVRYQVPGADVYDPDKDPARDNPRQERTPQMRNLSLGWVYHDIVYDAELDDSLFSLEPPPGYAVRVERRPGVPEKEMVQHLGTMAEYYHNTFPDNFDANASRYDKAVRGRVVPAWFPPDEELIAFETKPEKDRTPAQNKIIEARERYLLSGLNLGPFRHFIRDHVVEGTWRYLGIGVTLGDKDRIVCWYKLKGVKTYRVVYGDLSIKDVPPEALPLSVEP